MARVDGGVFRRCAFRRNGGPGLWMDIHVRNVLVTECVFQENELSGLFIEISRDIKVYDPTREGMVIDRNLYFSDAEQKMFLYGVTWRPKHLEFDEIASFADHTGFDERSLIADPVFVNVQEGDYRFQPDSPAWKTQVGWLMAPSDIDKWIAELLPSFKH